MNADELKRHLKSLHIDLKDNSEAYKFFTAKEYSNFYLTSSGIGIKNISLIKEFLFDKFQLCFFKLYALKHLLLSKRINLKGEKYLIVHNFWSGGYHHWLAEALFKLVMFENNYNDYTLLLPDDYPQFAIQSLYKFQFKDIVYLRKHHIYYINNGIVINNPKSGFFLKEHIDKVRDFYLTFPNKPFRKIYISRRNEKLRTIVNEEVIYSLLVDNGYEIIEPQLLTFQEQVTVFSETAELISIHGAALTNIIFMQPGTKVTELYRELFMDDKMNLCYYRLAQAASINYNIYFLKIANKKEDIDRSDLIVNKKDFSLMLTPNYEGN